MYHIIMTHATTDAKIECVERCIKELEPYGLVDPVNVLKKRLKELKQRQGSVQKEQQHGSSQIIAEKIWDNNKDRFWDKF